MGRAEPLHFAANRIFTLMGAMTESCRALRPFVGIKANIFKNFPYRSHPAVQPHQPFWERTAKFSRSQGSYYYNNSLHIRNSKMCGRPKAS